MHNFSPIIAVRDRKLNALKEEEREIQITCAVARNRTQEAFAAMNAYAEEIRTLEIDLLNELLETELRAIDIAGIEGQLKKAEQKAQELAASYQAAQRLLEATEKEASQTRAKRVQAQAKLNKVTELNRLMENERRLEMNRLQDAEQDEFMDSFSSSSNGFF